MDIALALGGGGSRGHSHIGVIRSLVNEGFRIRAVAGTSAGGLVAACYSAGITPDDMEKIFIEADQSKLYARSSKDGPSILGLGGVEVLLENVFGDKKIEDLIIPCGITSVDIKTAREIVITKGKVVDALLATIALPGIFPPMTRGEYLLVDGGVLDPVPVAVVRNLSKNLPVVAVVLTPFVDTEKRQLKGIQLPVIIPSPLANRLQRTRIAQAFNIFLLSVDAAGRMLTELRLKIDAPEIIIRPDVGHIGLLDKVDVHEIVRLGEEAVIPYIDQLKKITGWKHNLSRRIKRISSR
ncbi:MAG: patatin-like phospholipase family protein [Chloroflexota bacterium]